MPHKSSSHDHRAMRTYKVAIIQQVVPHYRVPFFRALSARCEIQGIHLTLIHGPEKQGSVPKSFGQGVLSVSQEKWIPAKYVGFGLIWQSALKESLSSDMVVVEHANRHLINHILLLARLLGKSNPKFAFWGHGANLQTRPSTIKERIKRIFRSHADFWFCYTQQVFESLAEIPAHKKISVDNAIDTAALKSAIQNISATTRKDPFNLLFIGSMRPDKLLPFLLSSIEIVFKAEPKTTMTFIGDGPDSHLVQDFCNRYPSRAHWHGPLLGIAAAPYLWRAGAITIPGLIGLVVLDSFVAEAPIVTTTNDGKHSPEFTYCQNGINSMVAHQTPEDYGKLLLNLLNNESLQQTLRMGCRESADRYTIDNMANKFFNGIMNTLKVDPQ